MVEQKIICGKCNMDAYESYRCADGYCPCKDGNDIAILDNPFEGYSKDDIIWSQHNIILDLKKKVAELERDLMGHLKKCIPY